MTKTKAAYYNEIMNAIGKNTKIKKLDGSFFLPNTYFFTQTLGYVEAIYHSHTFFEVVYVLSGEAMHTANGVTEKITAGDILFLRPGDAHTFIYTDPGNFLRTDITFEKYLFEKVESYFPNGLLKNFLSAKSIFKTCVSNEQIRFFENEIKIINDTKNADIKDALIFSFLASLLTILIKNTEDRQNKKYPLWLNQFISFLNVSDNLKRSKKEIFATLDSFNYNYSYISRAFKKNTGITMTEYINNIKFSTAHSLLISSNHSIGQIMDFIGLTNKSYFYREFKKRFKITPIKLRKN